jgi:hypothetical protein
MCCPAATWSGTDNVDFDAHIGCSNRAFSLSKKSKHALVRQIRALKRRAATPNFPLPAEETCDLLLLIGPLLDRRELSTDWLDEQARTVPSTTWHALAPRPPAGCETACKVGPGGHGAGPMGHHQVAGTEKVHPSEGTAWSGALILQIGPDPSR